MAELCILCQSVERQVNSAAGSLTSSLSTYTTRNVENSLGNAVRDDYSFVLGRRGESACSRFHSASNPFLNNLYERLTSFEDVCIYK